MKNYNLDETIAAVATPPGEGGVAIIRISGKEAFDIAGKIFSGPVNDYKSHTAHFGKFLDGETIVDEGLVLVMRAPRSYTGEDTVEINCHGGSLVTKKMMDLVLKAGARAAGPGEFTFRSFINGKLDLAQAEAVQTLIGAKNELALQMSKQQLEGSLSKRVADFQKELVDTAAILEAWVDFPEEGLEFASLDEIVFSLNQTNEKMKKLLSTFHEGKMIHEGFTLCLAGSPNVGKSSLMNALLGKDRAIVTDIAGTTRDLLEEDFSLGQLHFRLLDTAGIRETEEVVEKEGIRRTKMAMEAADLILYVCDATRPEQIPEKEKMIIVWNKIDLPHGELHDGIKVSAKTGEGIEALKKEIQKVIWQNGLPAKDEVVITQLRHKQALEHAIAACERLIDGLQSGVSAEFLSSEMRLVLMELGTIIGTDITEDILTSIFSKFCVGK